jgi:hypothetical protein
VALFAAAAQVSATDKAVTIATLLHIPFALEAERLVPIVKRHMIRSAINRRQFTAYLFFMAGYLLGTRSRTFFMAFVVT